MAAGDVGGGGRGDAGGDARGDALCCLSWGNCTTKFDCPQFACCGVHVDGVQVRVLSTSMPLPSSRCKRSIDMVEEVDAIGAVLRPCTWAGPHNGFQLEMARRFARAI